MDHKLTVDDEGPMFVQLQDLHIHAYDKTVSGVHVVAHGDALTLSGTCTASSAVDISIPIDPIDLDSRSLEADFLVRKKTTSHTGVPCRTGYDTVCWDHQNSSS